jgi:ATP synthase protein I
MPAAEQGHATVVAFFCRFFVARWARPGTTEAAAVVMDVKHVVPVTLLAQLCVSIVAAAVCWAGFGGVAAVSAALGGATAVVPNAFLAARLLTPTSDLGHQAMLRSAWIGEMGKLLLTVLLFGVIFGFLRPLAPLAVFVTFIAVQLVPFGALLIGDSGSPKELMTKS